MPKCSKGTGNEAAKFKRAVDLFTRVFGGLVVKASASGALLGTDGVSIQSPSSSKAAGSIDLIRALRYGATEDGGSVY